MAEPGCILTVHLINYVALVSFAVVTIIFYMYLFNLYLYYYYYYYYYYHHHHHHHHYYYYYYFYHYLKIVSFIPAIVVDGWLFFFSMSALYFSLRQRNVLILLTTNPFFSHPLFFSFSHPLLFSNLYCLMDSTFLRMLAVPSKKCFCKVSTLYDMPNLFKLHSKSFGMDPGAPIIIGSINVSLSHILAIFNRSSE